MKLFELAAKRPTDNAKKVFESYFGGSVNFDKMTDKQARQMLKKVRGLINEHRSSPQFHQSEKNSSYLKLVVMEQGLAARIRETSTVPVGSAAGANLTAAQDNAQMAPSNPTVAAGDAAKAQQRAQVKNPPANASQDAAKATKDLTTMAAVAAKSAQGVAQQNNLKTATAQAGVQQPGTTQPPAATRGSMGESRKKLKQARMMEGAALYHALLESEVQQAQVVLAAQDMVDQIQKMLEDVTAMQFKDLPALVDQIKTQVGVNEATQFNDQTNSTLGTLVENIQAAKGGLEQAMAGLTGQAPVVPGEAPEEGGEELGGEELPAELGGEEEGEELPVPAELGGEEEEGGVEGELGRARR